MRQDRDYLLYENKKLKEQNKLLRECVEYYSQETWDLTITNILGQETIFNASSIGKKARGTLKKVNELEVGEG